MYSLRPRKSLQEGLSPWRAKQSEEQDKQMDEFCHQALPKLSQYQPLCLRVNQQFNQLNLQPPAIRIRVKRPVSNVHSIREAQEQKNIFDRLSANMHKQTTTRSANKSTRQDIKQRTINPLQQVCLRNFIIEGTRESNRQGGIRKKQSSYVMKQKFVQIRRSMNLQLGIWGSVHKPNNAKEFKKEDKENMLLKLTRYQI